MVHFDGRAVGGAPGANIFIYGAITNTLAYDGEKIPGRIFGPDQITCAELFCGCVHRQATFGSCFDRNIAHFDGRAVRGAPVELRALFDVPLRALFGYGVISGRVWA